MTRIAAFPDDAEAHAPVIVELVACPAPVIPAEGTALAEVPFSQHAWLPGEIDTLRHLFAGDATIPDNAAATRRSIWAVRERLAVLGLRRASSRPWGEMEDDELVRRYGQDATADIASDFGRSCGAVYARAGSLGLTESHPPPWTPWEDAQLRTGYLAGVALVAIGEIIGRSTGAVSARAGALGCKHPARSAPWPSDELAHAVTLIVAGHRYEAVRGMLTAEGYAERSLSAIKQLAGRLGIGRGWGRNWTREEDDLLREAYRDAASLPAVAARLGRPPGSVRWRAGHLGLRGTHAKADGFRAGPVWTKTDIATLRALYGTMPMDALAHRMGRTRAALFTRANLLGLVHGYHRAFTPDERAAVRIAHANGIALADLATALGRKAATLSKYTGSHGLSFGRRERLVPPPTLATILALGASGDQDPGS